VKNYPAWVHQQAHVFMKQHEKAHSLTVDTETGLVKAAIYEFHPLDPAIAAEIDRLAAIENPTEKDVDDLLKIPGMKP
jgi:hypothetical protein